jgi:hypothetical protein
MFCNKDNFLLNTQFNISSIHDTSLMVAQFNFNITKS